MSAYPARHHTRRGEAIARGILPLCCHEQPDADCPCDACRNYWTAWERRTTPSTSLARSAQ